MFEALWDWSPFLVAVYAVWIVGLAVWMRVDCEDDPEEQEAS